MDNLWIYLLLIFVYVGYSIMRGARKQREAAAKQGKLKIKHTLSVSIPSEGKVVERASVRSSLSRRELSEEAKPLMTLRKSPLSDTERESVQKPVLKKSGKIPAAPQNSPALKKEEEENPYAMETSSFRSREELRRGIILSEILHRKYS
ncbi:MAG: hypothetical protein LUI04_03615 [Porphyromonadaceae bacterium]|nr:hypothetical protein [Porphyromonadaceae bacterium]